MNGTFVDSEKLKSNEPHPLYGGEEIQAGHLRMIYHHLDEMPTQPMASVDDTTQRVELELPAFRIDVIGPDQAFSPGAHMTAELSILNTSQTSQRFRVEVSGMPQDWIRIDRPELNIDPDEAGQVSINFKPLRRPDSKPGNYNVVLSVFPTANPDAKLEANLMIRILPYSGFGVALDSPRLASGERFRLHLHNQGSAVLPLTINGRNPSDKLRINVLTPQVSLAPGQRQTIQGEVKPKSPRLFGKSQQHAFDLVVRSQDPSHFLAAVRGQFTEKPMLPAWAPFLLAAAGLLVIAVVIAAAALLLRPTPTPTIAMFEVNSTQIAQGQSLVVNWAATDVNEYSLLLNGTPVLTDIDKDTPGVNLDTGGLLRQCYAVAASHQRWEAGQRQPERICV